MSALTELIKALLPDVESQAERDEAYLSASVDLYDLERRMREIDDRAHTLATGLQFGLVLR